MNRKRFLFRNITSNVQVSEKKEAIFNKLAILFINYLILLEIIIFTMGIYILFEYGNQFLSTFTAYNTITLGTLIPIYLLYKKNLKQPNISYKIYAYLIGEVYIVLLSIFAGKEAGIEIGMLAILPLPYFVNDLKQKTLIAISLMLSSIIIISLNIYLDNYPAIFPIPGFLNILTKYLALIFVILIISFGSEHFWKETHLAEDNLNKEKKKIDSLLGNILPQPIIIELTKKNVVYPKQYDSTSILFTDFTNFTSISEKITPLEVISELDIYFSYYDSLMDKYKLEKLKTIGDSYMCAGGLPITNNTHAIDCILCALDMLEFSIKWIIEKQKLDLPFWNVRIGIHTGSIIAGVIGEKKFSYDVWGDTVNTASRMESNSKPGKITISKSTYTIVQNLFECEVREPIDIKGKGLFQTYFVNSIKAEFSVNGLGKKPNDNFWSEYSLLK